ncbi:hypothetical protein M885DRAFT_620593 [Pelagophyceae sp. CCMP2097]|nr:hypothetical protein M885DRAFT_620593 [Pelagophyceae sp. CCMP2097]
MATFPSAVRASKREEAPAAREAADPASAAFDELEPSALSMRFFDVSDVCLEIEEDPSGTLGYGNGATCWDSSLLLATVLSQTPPALLPRGGEWAGCRVLELGAGCGLVSATLAALGGSVVATERPLALPLLQRNAQRNAQRAALKVLALDWADEERWRAVLAGEAFDVVVGCDLVFHANAAVHASLADIFAAALRRGSEAWLVHEIREVGIEGSFRSMLLARGVRSRRLQIQEAPPDILILELTLAQGAPASS